MAYCTALEVWDSLQLTNDASESFTSVSDGSDMDLSNKYLIQDAFTQSENSELSADQDVIVTDSTGTVQATSDYSVDLRDGTVTNDSMGTGDYTVRYKYAPLPNSTIQNTIADVTADIDDITNTTFDGTVQVTDTYSGDGRTNIPYQLRERPVDSVSQVRVNDATAGDADDWNTLTEGRDEDYLVVDGVGVLIHNNSVAPEDDLANLEVQYSYGFSSLPDEINRLARIMVMRELMNNNVVAAQIEGKNNFDPQTTESFISEKNDIISRWTVEEFGGDTDYVSTA